MKRKRWNEIEVVSRFLIESIVNQAFVARPKSEWSVIMYNYSICYYSGTLVTVTFKSVTSVALSGLCFIRAPRGVSDVKMMYCYSY